MTRPTHWDQRLTTRRRSGAQERRIARDLGAKLTPNSGAGIEKSDAVDARFRYEMKTTTAGRVPVSSSVLRKIWVEAVASGKHPVVVVTMESMRYPTPKDWVLLEKYVFEMLINNEEV